MRAGIAFNQPSARAGKESQVQLKNYRPEFESIVLGRFDRGLDSGKVHVLGEIIGDAYREADRKGTGDKIRAIFHDFAARIDNNIVKLASQRMRDVVRRVDAEHLPEFLESMHREMLRSPERADAIPEAMLNTYIMSGGRLSASAVARVVRIGFSKSRTLCPKEVSQTIQRDYESGQLDQVREVAAIREQSRTEGIVQDAPLVVLAAPVYAANDCKQAEAPLPEAVPIVHFLKADKSEDGQLQVRSISQAVPEIVAREQKEKVRQRKEKPRKESLRVAAADWIAPVNVRLQNQETPGLPAAGSRAAKRTKEPEQPEKSKKARMQKLPQKEETPKKKTKEKAVKIIREAVGKLKEGQDFRKKHDARVVEKIKPTRMGRMKMRKTEPIAQEAGKKMQKKRITIRNKISKKPETEPRAKARKSGYSRDKMASFKIKSETIMKMKREKNKKMNDAPKKARSMKLKKPEADKKAGSRQKKAKESMNRKPRVLRAKTPMSCSKVVRKVSGKAVLPQKAEAIKKARAVQKILAPRKRARLGEILFKLGF